LIFHEVMTQTLKKISAFFLIALLAAIGLCMAANAAPLELTIVYSNHVNGRLMPFQT
jgi:hypothetical protein